VAVGFSAALVLVSPGAETRAATNPTVTIAIDGTAKVHPIDPRIYGVAWGSSTDVAALNAPLNRMGGNAMTDYNWALNAQNLAADWYFESYPEQSSVPGEEADTFVSNSKAANTEPMLTVPLLGWVANLGANRTILSSFSVAKYGPQCAADPYFPTPGMESNPIAAPSSPAMIRAIPM
jgi:hypothetical protein